MSVDPSPPAGREPLTDRGQLGMVVGVSLFVRVGYLLFKPESVVSLDVGMWKQAADVLLRGENPYLTDTMAFLPLWPAIIWAMARMSQAFGVSFTALLWGLLILTETAVLLVTFRLLRRWVSATMARNILLIAIALNPAAVFQVTQHGNIDVLFMLFVMLSLGAMIRFHDQGEPVYWLRAGAWLGLGILTKTAPIALASLLTAGASRLPRSTVLWGAMLLLGPALIGFAIIFPSAPAQVWRMVVQYRSVHGYFGISGFMGMIDGVEFPFMGPMLRLQSQLFDMGLPLAMLIIAIQLFLNGWRDSAHIPLAAGLMFLAILIFGIGFGAQHIYWLIPPLAVSYGAIDDPRWRRLLIIGWAVVAITYTYEYLIISSTGALLRALFPTSDLLYRFSLVFVTPADHTIFRLPLFCVFVAVLIEGMRQLRRSGFGEKHQP